MTSATIVASDRAARLYSAGLLLALAAGLIASLLVFLVEPISDFLGEGAIRATGLEGGARRAAIGLLLLGSTVALVAACWRAGAAALAVATVAAVIALAAAGPFAMPAVVLAAAALAARAACDVERDRLGEYAPRRHPLAWAAGSAGAAVLLVTGAATTWYLVTPLIDRGASLDEALGFAVVPAGSAAAPAAPAAATPAAATPAASTAAPATPTAAPPAAATPAAAAPPPAAATPAATPVAATPAATLAPATPAPDTPAPDTPAPATPAPATPAAAGAAAAPASVGMLIASGQLVGADSFHHGSGAVLLVRAPDGSGMLRFEDYEVRNGPDLHVFLTLDPAGDVHAAGAVDLGAVRATRGNVNYELPAGIELDSLRVAVIYCVPFRVVFATAELN
ncbi:MAG: DM13 domain-containing protein [Dehalococcoidia bacterium]|nr:DM13 domain-containing protein [Dehalococcoidia bacterium]